MLLLYSDVCFFKQKTAYEMRISDWSSDVCSSDLSQGRCCALSLPPGNRSGSFRQGVRAVRNAAPRACSLSTGSPFPWPARHQRPRMPPRSEPTDRIASETHAAFLALALSRSASFLPFRFQPSVRHLWAPGLAEPNHILPAVTSSVFAGRYMHRNPMCEVEVSTVCA